MGNQKERVDYALENITGPIPGEKLLENFKAAMATEPVLQKMFGNDAERVFVNEMPSLNETITPGMLLSWRDETFSSNNVYLDGFVDLKIFLPVRLQGDYNALRKIASIFQRWMSGRMDVINQTPGLTKFGYGTTFNYDGLAQFNGFTCPVITAMLPYRFDLAWMRNQIDGYDPTLPLDDAEYAYVDQLLFTAIETKTNPADPDLVLLSEGVLVRGDGGQV